MKKCKINDKKELFLQLLQIALENRERFDTAPTEKEWQGLLEEASRQAVVGVTCHVFERLSEDQLPPRRVKMQWCGLTEFTREKSSDMNDKVGKVATRLSQHGFDSMLLKGAGTALLYPDPTVRTNGDIDIWAWPKEMAKASLAERRKVMVDYARRYDPTCDVCYHHTSLPALRGTKIELHFTPTWMNAPKANRFLQHRFDECRTEGKYKAYSPTLHVNIPSLAFNVVYPLIHICRHLFSEGIGMRHIVDYYYILRMREQSAVAARKANEAFMQDIRQLGLCRLTAAMMWVLKEGLGLPEEYLLCKPDERRGRFLLNEIMQAGNFGQDDARVEGMNDAPLPKRALLKTSHDLRHFTLCPAEAFWSFGFKAWQWMKRIQWNKVVTEE